MLLNRKPQSLVAQVWTRTEAPDAPVTPVPNGLPAHCLLDASVRITGDLCGRGDVRLEGQVCGNVTCAQLTVGPDAAITGAVRAGQVVVSGRVTGTIRANLVILRHTARVEAEITYGLLALDEGAAFEGLARCRPNPLQEDDPTSALDDLQRMLETPRPGTAACAAEVKGRGSRREPPPRTHPPNGEGDRHATEKAGVDDGPNG